jgi:hypothetical protein
VAHWENAALCLVIIGITGEAHITGKYDCPVTLAARPAFSAEAAFTATTGDRRTRILVVVVPLDESGLGRREKNPIPRLIPQFGACARSRYHVLRHWSIARASTSLDGEGATLEHNSNSSKYMYVGLPMCMMHFTHLQRSAGRNLKCFLKETKKLESRWAKH